MITNFSTSSIASGIKRKRFWDQSASIIFAGGNQTVASLYDLMSLMVNFRAEPVTTGGTLTINAVNLGSYDYTIKKGDQTISSFTVGDWFNATSERSALIAVNGNLTIGSGQTFIPSVRKLFTCIYVNGNLTIDGSISMTARGANHSAIAEGVILLKPGTSVGSGGAAGGNGFSDGGGGLGAAGTIFTGGAGGGAGAASGAAGNGVTRGGAGGNAAGGGGFNTAGGGAGNPGGSGAGSNAGAGSTGTGGTLFIYCTGTLSGSGSVVSNGTQGGSAGTGDHRRSSGGGTGGGHVTIMRGSGTITVNTNGGAAGARTTPTNPEGSSGAGQAGVTGAQQIISI